MRTSMLIQAVRIALVAATPVLAAAETTNESNGQQTTLFVIGPNMGLVGFDSAESLSGPGVTATTDLMLSKETVKQPRDGAVDHNGTLYLISGTHGGSVAMYDNPLTASGNRPPDRVVAGKKTLISRSPTGIAIDSASNLLYVANVMNDVQVFDISDPSAFAGEVAPIRAFKVDMAQIKPQQLCFANGALYMVDARGGSSDILVFDDPGSLSGKIKPSRVISCTGFDNKIGINVDAQDRMLVGVRKPGRVLIFNDAKTLDGASTPDVTLTIEGPKVDPKPSFVTTDSQDRLYVADASGNAVFAFDKATELESGTRSPDRTIDCRDLTAPNRLVLVERGPQDGQTSGNTGPQS